VREWLASPPSWLQLRSVQVFSKPTILHLGRGEAEAISLAIELGIRNVLIDEKLARYEAKERKLLVSGTLGILAQASRLGSCDLRSAISRLKKTNFRASPAVYAEFLRRNP
jgi:predicted nucleic acid-binding protein